MLAGGVGGTSGDMLMHSLDTVKTRQQGDPHIPAKYTSMSSSYVTILRQEGIRRGLYSGVTPALLGSFPGTVIFFGVYEYTKRHMIDMGIAPSISYLSSGKDYPLSSGCSEKGAMAMTIPDTGCFYYRVCRRSGCLGRLRPFGGVENSPAAPGAV
jgi:hypothetical protein